MALSDISLCRQLVNCHSHNGKDNLEIIRFRLIYLKALASQHCQEQRCQVQHCQEQRQDQHQAQPRPQLVLITTSTCSMKKLLDGEIFYFTNT